MKLLLILGSDDYYSVICENTAALGYESIRYRHVLKAIDNIDEIDPAAVIISARDFPRHWKILVQFIRSERSKEACPIIIIKGKNFDSEETSKAFFLGANGVINGTLHNDDDVDSLKKILGRKTPVRRHVKPDHLQVEPQHRIGLLIANFSGSLVQADVATISSKDLSFTPHKPLPPKAVKLNKKLPECSLRTGNSILSPQCKISGAGKTISLEFVSFPEGEQQILNRYLEEIAG